ncbi:DUF1465 family protein [Pyruvatibacter mobilis]|jgi:regulator of CtrA degradation|uniref:DUF1465 family protein n=1 Tax=Pyruvatibacter mobilis TaxID=1712261 RepID=A0A845QEC2_9HYPH|nr:DUF1465 family protein [Pyruvatibacter mobilis]NBG96744.1 DUF1465 family protein [Pyruvatibacter mobilis]QJD74263.1 DUF1465 family protein [Pyruvatibacter mobilis]GGD05420.1 hypothetical protein GCM10011587_06650 [Pyruvatibacter mobilis]
MGTVDDTFGGVAGGDIEAGQEFSVRSFAGSAQFEQMFKDGMGMVEEAASYLDGPGRDHSKTLSRKGALAYAAESMRLTTRLMQVASWLLVQRAVARGEMTVAEAASDKYRLGAKELCYARPIEGADELPAELADMISQSRRLYARIDRLDKMMHGDASETEPKTAVARQLSKIESAFRQMRLDGQLH